jgi:hypothetical protein
MNTVYIDKVIDNCLADKLSIKSLQCRRGNPDLDALSILHFFSNNQNNSRTSSSPSLPSGHQIDESSSKIFFPYPPKTYVILLEERKEELNDVVIKGVAIWYIGYSTWKGKVMNLDTLCTCDDDHCNYVNDAGTASSNSSYKKILVNVIVKIAQCLEFNRIVYQVSYKF